MKKFGLIGKSLGHSFSKIFFEEFFDKHSFINYEYNLYELNSLEELMDLWEKNPELIGLNVTIPFKEKVILYLDELSPVAKEINAVNVILRQGHRLSGGNTDGPAFLHTLNEFIPLHFQSSALVLGNGGASKAVQWALKMREIPFTVVSRNPDFLNYAGITEDILIQHKLIINTTSLGMHPMISQAPELPYSSLNKEFYLYDLVYNPEKTIFLIRGTSQGARVKNGLAMLIKQAELSWQFWTKQ
ncbi:MAG: shikimate dehydrogenase [Bacteroidota bacterium]|nr:shikimate dehydrogenase [Bacteroidota bacterium]